MQSGKHTLLLQFLFLSISPSAAVEKGAGAFSQSQNSYDSSTDCPATTHGQSGDQQDSNTVGFECLFSFETFQEE